MAVRLLLLPWFPVPVPEAEDEFCHLLIGDTLAQGRLTNPTHPYWRHFETVFVLHQPTYTAKYTPGQGMVLALGQSLTGEPWAGVWLCAGLMCGAICWMLQGWLPSAWALIGGLLAAMNWGIFSYWMNSYWGGAFAALGGALLFGALGRLLQGQSLELSLVLGLGWGIIWLTRPFEAAILGAVLGVIVLAKLRRSIVPVGAMVVVFAAFSALYNLRVTGDPALMPYELARVQYGVPQSFYFQPVVPEPPFRHKELRDIYLAQRQERTTRGSLGSLANILDRTWSFYFGLPLTLPLLLHRRRLLLALVVVAIAASMLYPFYFAHYFAMYAGVFLLFVLDGLRRIGRWPAGSYLAVGLVAWSLLGGLRPIGPWMRHGPAPPTGRADLVSKLAKAGGQHLVFVRYDPHHDPHREWVYNAADIDAAPIVWAREIDPAADAQLIRQFPGRSIWLAHADRNEWGAR